MLVHMQAALSPPRVVLGVYVDDLAFVAECLRRVVAAVERELLVQARSVALAAAPHKSVLAVCRTEDADRLRRWLSSRSGLLSSAIVRSDGAYLGVSIGPSAPRLMRNIAASKCAQRTPARPLACGSTGLSSMAPVCCSTCCSTPRQILRSSAYGAGHRRS